MPKPSRPACVIFDLGMVLVAFDLSQGVWARFREVFGPPGQRTESGLKWEKLYDGYARGRIDPQDFHREFCELSRIDFSWEDFVTQWCDIFHPLDGMQQLFEDVRAQVTVGLLSDTDPLHWEFVREHYPWLRQIENPTLSFATGALKPEPHAYQAAAANMGIDPHACFFTDDKPENIQGAIQAGMDAVLFEGPHRLRGQLADRGIGKID